MCLKRIDEEATIVGERMEYGIQRRSIYLVPPDRFESKWIMDHFDLPEIWEMFGLSGPSRFDMARRHREGHLVVGLLKRVEDQKRIGFVIMYPPTEAFDFWELGYAIPDTIDRDAFSAFNATDAMAHYMFEHLRVEAMGWRTRADNRAADAVIRRLGYKSYGAWEVDGHQYTFYRLDEPGWAKRRAKLDRGEAKHPSIGGDTFVTLEGPPFEPVT